MKIQPINVCNVYRSSLCKSKLQEAPQTGKIINQPSFKGDKGAVCGIIGGALIGVLGTAAIIATGGLAGVVGAVGYGATLVGGAAAGTHAGGIAGGIIEDMIDKKK